MPQKLNPSLKSNLLSKLSTFTKIQSPSFQAKTFLCQTEQIDTQSCGSDFITHGHSKQLGCYSVMHLHLTMVCPRMGSRAALWNFFFKRLHQRQDFGFNNNPLFVLYFEKL